MLKDRCFFKKNNKNLKKYTIVTICAALIAVVASLFISANAGSITEIFRSPLTTLKSTVHNILDWNIDKLFFARFVILFVIIFFCGMHFIINIKKMYQNLFCYRWLIGGVFLLVCTIFQIHGDSITIYDFAVQYGEGSEYTEPLFGVPRAIRSDEWVVDTPSILSAAYGEEPFGKYNKVLRGEDTLNIINGVDVGYSGIGRNPICFVYKLLGAQRGYCFYWNFRILFTLLISIELFYIITRRKKLLSAFGGSMIAFSSFYLWWGFPVFLAGAECAIVCIYYFLIARRKRTKLLYAIGVSISTAYFIVNLYPAWQVPMAYIVMAFLIWLIHDYWKLIKTMDWKDWIMFGCAFAFMVSLVVTYFYDAKEYIEIITQTVYPGTRLDNGGFALYKIMYYVQSWYYPIKDIANASESGVFFSVFPIPMFVALFLWCKSKKKDWLLSGLLLISVFLLLYVTVGLPSVIARVTLMDHSTPMRAVDLLGYANVLLMIVVLGRSKVKMQWNVWIGILIGVALTAVCVWNCNRYSGDYLIWSMVPLSGIMIVAGTVCMISDISMELRRMLYKEIMFLNILSGMCIRPVMMGFDAIYSKPVAGYIQEITNDNPTSKWITVSNDIILQGYAVACGAPTLNSVNTYPNMKLWKALDPEGKYNEIYNRYAHISVNLVEEETSMELIQADWINLHLSYSDLHEINVNYILSYEPIEYLGTEVDLTELYEESGIYVYEVKY